MKTETWVGTLNHWTLDEKERAAQCPDCISYCVLGQEVSSSGTPHLQAYFETTTRVRMSKMRNMLKVPGHACRWHLEKRLGTQEQAVVYCKKDNNWEEFGLLSTKLVGSSNAPKKGRTHQADQLDQLKDVVKTHGLKGAFEFDFANTVRFHSGLSKFITTISPEARTMPPKCEVFVGPTGTGKTRMCWEFINKFFGGDVYVHGGNPRFFDGYNGQRVVLFDDFDGSQLSLGRLKVLTDRYICSVEIKGGTVNWKPTRILFTTNTPVERWYPGYTEPLLRRMDIYECNENMYLENGNFIGN